MNETIAKLSAKFSRLSSLERMIIIVVLAGVFLLFHFMLVMPYVKDSGKINRRRNDAEELQKKFDDMIAQMPSFSNQIAKLEGENSAVPAEDQAVNFITAIQSQAAQSSVAIIANNRQPERTNQFFLERAQSVSTQSGEAQLVDFLYNLGVGNSLIRARALSLTRDQSQQQLRATMTLIASFQKKAPVRAATTSNSTKPASTTTATNSAPKDATKPPAPAVPAVKPGVPPTPAGPKPSTPNKK